MTITGAALLTDMGYALQDPSQVVWTEPILVGFINEAILTISSLRPDAVAETVTFPVVENTAKQSIPGDGFALLEVTRNIGGNYRAISMVEMGFLDKAVPEWSNPSSGVTAIELVLIDSRSPKQFHIYPVPATGTTLDIELIYAKTPTSFTAAATSLPLDDIWMPAMKEYVFWRAYGMNSKRMDLSRATYHLNAFYNLLNVKMQNDSILETEKKG